MKGRSAHPRAAQAGFTLLELLVGMGASGVLMASIVASSVALQRSFFWSANYSEQSNAQLRALDFVTRDVRRSRSVSVTSTDQWITLEIPDTYTTYDAQGNPTSALRDPVIVRGNPEYGDPTLPIYVVYYLNGETLMRWQSVSASGAITEVVIASGIRSFRAELVGGGNLVRATVTFRPRLRADQASEDRTAMAATVAARPMRMKYADNAIP